ncbi:MAG: methylated-DNA--[protein]-cysteine S-methyltransferase [Spirochaetota bacterium]
MIKKEEKEKSIENPYYLLPFVFNSEIGRFYCYFSKKGLFQMLLEKDLAINESMRKFIKICNLKEASGTFSQFAQVNFETLKEEFSKYFKKQKVNFTIPIDFSFYTDFQKKVLNYLIKIPYGKVESYKNVAENIGMPKAYRAVGNAVASNRTLIVVPCHRVIKSDGSIGWFGGYGNGKELKSKILMYEGISILS